MRRRIDAFVSFVLSLLLVLALLACSAACSPDGSSAVSQPSTNASSPTTEVSTDSAESSDDLLAELFKDQKSDVQVQGQGTVIRLLTDDSEGNRHQRFILELDSGQTLLITHNIDIAPRLDVIAVGDRVEFYGVYFYNEQGGGIHWTHHDPKGQHISGWLKWNGEKFG